MIDRSSFAAGSMQNHAHAQSATPGKTVHCKMHWHLSWNMGVDCFDTNGHAQKQNLAMFAFIFSRQMVTHELMIENAEFCHTVYACQHILTFLDCGTAAPKAGIYRLTP